MITGPCGVGKTWLARAPLRHASMPCRAVDDWGPERLNASQRRDLMEIVED